MKKISKARFDAMAGYARRPDASSHFTEKGWFQDGDLLALIVKDVQDGDYSSAVFSQDSACRYRLVKSGEWHADVASAEAEVTGLFCDIRQGGGVKKHGDEPESPVDFFGEVENIGVLNDDFLRLKRDKELFAAREIIGCMMRWYRDIDGDFIKKFQTDGFYQRLWELYIFALLSERNYYVCGEENSPDFVVTGLRGVRFCIEATTISPAGGGKLRLNYLRSLKKKLRKKYYELKHVRGFSLSFAINNMNGLSGDYGNDLFDCLYDDSDECFFNLDGAEEVSAVITNPGVSVGKFNRMGMLAGFGLSDFSIGQFDLLCAERWIDGLIVYHNPKAKVPLCRSVFPEAKHCYGR